MIDAPKPLIFDDDAGLYLGNSKKTRANWRVMGYGPRFVKIGKKVAYHPDDIADWINARRVQSTSAKEAA